MKLRTLIPMSLMILGSFGFSGTAQAQTAEDYIRLHQQMERNGIPSNAFTQYLDNTDSALNQGHYYINELNRRAQIFANEQYQLASLCNKGYGQQYCNAYWQRDYAAQQQSQENYNRAMIYLRSKRRY